MPSGESNSERLARASAILALTRLDVRRDQRSVVFGRALGQKFETLAVVPLLIIATVESSSP